MTLAPPTDTAVQRRGSIGTAALGILLIVVGGAWLLDRLDVVDLEAGMILPAILTVMGIALMVGAWDGDHTGLVVLGVFVAVLTVFASVAPTGSMRNGVGDRTFVPSQVTALEPSYTLAIGQLEVDLSRIRDLDGLGWADLEVRVGAGEVQIILPEELPVSIDAVVGAGDIHLFGDEWSGVGLQQRYETSGYAGAADRLHLDLEVMAGKVEVRR